MGEKSFFPAQVQRKRNSLSEGDSPGKRETKGIFKDSVGRTGERGIRERKNDFSNRMAVPSHKVQLSSLLLISKPIDWKKSHYLVPV
ncbi:hypothetical protein CEXT_123181 [Caerostris extrusa]|uniref:Uncharacterized protein n=1 Tax=Caerostris extrusa TaxID=172846 RepID=A0AAV4XUA4_CAEEX|nr:hypothetical protein CEXT_123181 [Caerostris extrusa]